MSSVLTMKHFEQPNVPGVYGRMVCLNGKNKGVAHFLTGEGRAIMGRSEAADIPVMDIKSSREHAEIVKLENAFVVTDLGSQNGIYVNEAKITQHKLKNKDRVMIGKTVYRFNMVQVKEETAGLPSKEDEQKAGNKSALLVGGIVVVLIMLFMGEDKKTPVGSKQKAAKYKMEEIGDPFASAIKDRKSEVNKNKEKMNQYFQKGLREFREGNYFRALSEFNHALSWDPNDPLAQFYRRKTVDALDSTISEYFIKAKRDEEALKFQSALVSYCSIIRLLYNYPSDQRYLDATEGVSKIEEVMGYDEGEIKCLNMQLGGDSETKSTP
jgi:pSer/pThr/pTyr-binding forkhead associated (FHA) protein